MWGGTSCEHTCLGHNAKQPTRNDYMIVNAARHKSWKDWQAEQPQDEQATTEEDLPEKVWEATKKKNVNSWTIIS